ncbi:hypothetical protein ABZ953_26530 [Streptomyces sp. NPDC046465]|uniref:hypothetical protein n=1 Tax=Streptomyces sp. NPDC046465 TaxID=3155810 RepID=UPI0033D7A7DA
MRQQDAWSAELGEAALGAGGQDQIVGVGEGLGPGDGAPACPFDGREGVGVEGGAGDEGEAASDAVVAREDGEDVEEPVQGGGRPGGEEDALLGAGGGAAPCGADRRDGTRCPLPAARCPLRECPS